MASLLSPSITEPHRVIDLSTHSQTADPDRAIRIQHALTYFKDVWYLLAGLIGLASICHFLSILYAFQRKTPHNNDRARGSISLRRLPVAILDTLRAFAFRWTVPVGRSYKINFAEVFLSAVYITVLFVFSLMNSTSTKGVKYDPHYWANIAGNIVCTQLPLMIALGMRNNPISYLTGVSFDKLNYLHRMSARVICILIWLHGAGRIKLGLSGAVAWTVPYIQCGMLAGTSLTLLCIAGIRPLRDAHYEFFLVVHFLLAFIVVLSAYFHAQGLEFGYLIWPSFLIWGLDRLIRLIRIMVINFGYLKPNSKEMDASVDVLSPHLLRILIKRPSYVNWRPGQSFFITIPSVAFVDNHPFTVSTIDVLTTSSPTTNEKQDNLVFGNQCTYNLKKELVFFVQVRKGFTRRLLHAASDEKSFRVNLDGPYSSPPLLIGYDSVILISGGSGISFTLPLLLDLVHRARQGKVRYCRVALVWAIRSPEHIGWISETLSAAIRDLPASINLSVKIYVTEQTEAANENSSLDGCSDVDSEAKSTNLASEQSLLMHSVVQMTRGRVDLKTLIDEEVEAAIGPISISVCGTRTLTNSVRDVLKVSRFRDVLRGAPTITLHVEAFGA